MGNWIRCVIFIESNLCFLFKIVFNTGLYIRLYEVKKNSTISYIAKKEEGFQKLLAFYLFYAECLLFSKYRISMKEQKNHI